MICSSEAAESLKPKSAWEEEAACIGMKESYGVLRLMTYKFTLYVLFVCIYIYIYISTPYFCISTILNI